MARKDMKGALGASLQAEERALTDRFQRADAIFAKAEAATPTVAEHELPPTKVIRDSFTMPLVDYDRIANLRERCLKSGISVTKSQVLRAGLHALEQLTETELIELIGQLEKVKTGRPNHTV